MTKKSKKLALLLTVVGLTSVATLTPRKASADHIVCNDNLQFCLAGCTSFSPSNCRTKCYNDYNACEALFQPLQPPSTGGPR